MNGQYNGSNCTNNLEKESSQNSTLQLLFPGVDKGYVGETKKNGGAFGGIGGQKLAGCFQSFFLTIHVKVGPLAIRMVILDFIILTPNNVEIIGMEIFNT